MMQGLGILLVLAAGIGIGIFRARELRERPKQIRAVIQALSALEAQIVYAELPLADGFRDCTAICREERVKRMFVLLAQRLSADKRCSSGEAFREIRSQVCEEMSLGQAEWNSLSFLCDNLGRTDCRETEKQIALSIEQLKALESSAIAAAEKKGKAAVYLGICGALFVVLVCI